MECHGHKPRHSSVKNNFTDAAMRKVNLKEGRDLIAKFLAPIYCNIGATEHTHSYSQTLKNTRSLTGCNLILIICYLAQKKKGTNCILDNI